MATKKKPEKIKKLELKKNKKHQINYEKRAEFIRVYDSLKTSKKKNFTTTQKREITKKYNKLKQYTGITPQKVTKKEAKEYAARGYPVTKKGVIVDQLRDTDGKRIKNSHVRLLKSGIIKESVNKRTAYIVNLTDKEREQFLIDPKSVMLKYIKTDPVLKKQFTERKISNNKTQNITMQFGHMAGKEARSIDDWNYYLTQVLTPAAFAGYTEHLTGFRLTAWK